MSIEQLGITILWSFLYGYLIVGSIDFGAGFYAYYSRVSGMESIIGPVISRYLSPVWEVTNVFLVFFIVGIVGFFPETAYYYGTALLIPGSIALILLAIRGSFYAFANYGAKNNSFYLFAYGATGLLIPAALSTVFTISEGGFLSVRGSHVVLLLEELFFSAYSWAVVLLAMSSVLFISSTFLTYYAAARKMRERSSRCAALPCGAAFRRSYPACSSSLRCETIIWSIFSARWTYGGCSGCRSSALRSPCGSFGGENILVSLLSW
ncbi:hypothetical protein PACILC2_13180 [Paenibacillus cisolokensis]|uniref:Cytochrome D ubiquinol oxidase subunit II n=1 Tax=Paenibacillus cisolokensis TaxID=1658519 RepID=A0ABQ4N3J6_9BACL|nr:hypothetical protein PACILC2_13180 [Paenibacillus cisolokensis]